VIAGRTRRLTGRTGCGICGSDSIAVVLKELRQVPAGTPVRPASIQTALEALTERQALNAATGTVHAAAWASANGLIELVREDVGRHNALDKLIGAAVKQGVDPATGFVVVTSRASFEMVQKAMILGAPLLAAISGPTGLAVRVAEQSGMTLVGFARKDKLTVYTHPDRVVG
jgi:FdhD protein